MGASVYIRFKVHYTFRTFCACVLHSLIKTSMFVDTVSLAIPGQIFLSKLLILSLNGARSLESNLSRMQVVVKDDQQDVLPEHSQGLALLVHLGSIVRYLEAKPHPVVNLVEEADQVSTEADTNHPATGPTERRTIHFLHYFNLILPLAPPV